MCVMLSKQGIEFTKDNIDLYLKELAKEYRKLVGKGMPAELILIGGASVLINYGFRNMTTDIDALIRASSGMKDAIDRVGERFNLPKAWLNSDFQKTRSYTPKLEEFSKYYKTYSNILTIRTVAAEYLIAMKLQSGRQYKSDLSDVLGILVDHEKSGNPIVFERIQQAVVDLYGDWLSIPETSRIFILNNMEDGRFEQLYKKISEGEQETKSLMIKFNSEYPDVIKESNADMIAGTLQMKMDKASILAELRQRKAKEKPD